MARPHIPCLDTDPLPWQGGAGYLGLSDEFDLTDVDDETYFDLFAFKLLAYEEETGWQTKRERYRAGFSQHDYGYHRCAEEVFTLAGRYEYPDSVELFTAGCYVYRPPGWIHNGEILEDTEAIVRHDRRFSMVCGFGREQLRTNVLVADAEEAAGPRGFVVHVDQRFLPWMPAAEYLRSQEPWDESPGDGMAVKLLSRDVHTGAHTALIRLAPGFRLAEPAFATAYEETYVLAGELRIGDDLLSERYFVARPAGIAHGPVESPAGCLFYSTFGGRLGKRSVAAADVGRRVAEP